MIHGDYGPYNLLLKPGAPVVVLDFELARLDWRVVDVAKAMQQFALTRKGIRPARAHRFVSSYAARTSFEEAERRLIPDVWLFLTLRRVIVCWDRHATTGEGRWLREAGRKLALAEAIRAADMLHALEAAGTGTGDR